MRAEILVATNLSLLWNLEMFHISCWHITTIIFKNVHSSLEPYLTIIVIEKLFLSLSGECKDTPLFLVDLPIPSLYVF